MEVELRIFLGKSIQEHKILHRPSWILLGSKSPNYKSIDFRRSSLLLDPGNIRPQTLDAPNLRSDAEVLPRSSLNSAYFVPFFHGFKFNFVEKCDKL